jgi:hypothetical protein
MTKIEQNRESVVGVTGLNLRLLRPERSRTLPREFLGSYEAARRSRSRALTCR